MRRKGPAALTMYLEENSNVREALPMDSKLEEKGVFSRGEKRLPRETL